MQGPYGAHLVPLGTSDLVPLVAYKENVFFLWGRDVSVCFLSIISFCYARFFSGLP